MARGVKRSFSRGDLANLLDRALDEDGTVIIKRPGRKDIVVMSADRLPEMDTTAYLLSSPRNRRRLMGALKDVRAGKGQSMTVKELRKRVGL
jgi:antitoxin YefM